MVCRPRKSPTDILLRLALHFTLLSDNLSREKRSKVMASIRSKNTKPEMTVRKLLWSMKKHYRVHDRTIFGTPDISNKRAGIAVFIDGCFWHGCSRCYTEPKTNSEFWKNKISTNRKRRTKVRMKLRGDGWEVLEFWEHQINQNPQKISEKISHFL